jgi:hypothetical protein
VKVSVAAVDEGNLDAQDQFVGIESGFAIANPEHPSIDRPLAARAAGHDPRVERQQDRQGVAGRRGVGDIAAERASVLDLGGSDGCRRLDEDRHVAATRLGAPNLRVCRQGSEAEHVTDDVNPAQLVEPPQVEHA